MVVNCCVSQFKGLPCSGSTGSPMSGPSTLFSRANPSLNCSGAGAVCTSGAVALKAATPAPFEGCGEGAAGVGGTNVAFGSAGAEVGVGVGVGCDAAGCEEDVDAEPLVAGVGVAVGGAVATLVGARVAAVVAVGVGLGGARVSVGADVGVEVAVGAGVGVEV